MPKRWIFALLLATLFCTVQAQGSADGYMTVSAQQQATWTRNFNPFVADNRFPTNNGVFEPSMIYNTVQGELEPWLATDYAWGDGDKTLTLTYRDDVTWSDGEAFTAKDVAYTFNLLKETEGLNGTAVGAMNGENAYVSSVEATDDKTVVFTFSRVFTPGLYDIMHQNIVPEHVWTGVEDPLTFLNENPVGTGPFTEITQFQNQIYAVGKNPNYWQAGKPYIEGMRFPAYPGNDQANLATLNGENDWANNFIPDIERTFVEKDPENYGYWFPSLGATIMLYLNTTEAPFDNADVRKAISMAINREQVVTVAMYNYTIPADVTGLSEAYPSYKVSDPGSLADTDWTQYDVAKANEMLDAAGLTMGSDNVRTTADGKPLTFDINVVSGWSDWVSAVNIIAQNLKAVGINASVKTYDFSAWIDRVQKGDFSATIGWSSGGATPFNYYRGQMSKLSFKPVGEVAGENWQRFVSEDADKLLDQFAAVSDSAEQEKIAGELQRVFAEAAPAVPLFPGPMWFEYNTTNFTNFPTEEDPYVVGSPFNGAPEALLAMTEIKPK